MIALARSLSGSGKVKLKLVLALPWRLYKFVSI
jgi:hypothetical protein